MANIYAVYGNVRLRRHVPIGSNGDGLAVGRTTDDVRIEYHMVHFGERLHLAVAEQL